MPRTRTNARRNGDDKRCAATLNRGQQLMDYAAIHSRGERASVLCPHCGLPVWAVGGSGETCFYRCAKHGLIVMEQ